MKFNQFFSSQISAIFHDNIEHHISDFSCCNFSKEVQNVLANQIGFKFAHILVLFSTASSDLKLCDTESRLRVP
jgi:hypothetical protein